MSWDSGKGSKRVGSRIRACLGLIESWAGGNGWDAAYVMSYTRKKPLYA